MTGLHHGDCLEVMRGISDGSVDMVMADPPYGTTACRWDTVIPLEPMWEHLRRAVKPKGAIVLMACQPFTSALIMSNSEMFRYCWVWEKSNATGFLDANRRPLRAHEDVCVFAQKGTVYNPQKISGKPYIAQRKGQAAIYGNHDNPRTVLQIPTEAPTGHTTAKPVALMEYMIRTYTQEGDTVLDFCMGSGTTGVACANLNRDFIGIEMDETYFNLATERIRDTPPLLALR